MVVFPVLVAFHTYEWIPIAVESYLAHFPEDRLLVVDNNPRPGESGWSPAFRRERHWLLSHPRIDVIDDRAIIPGVVARRTHGSGMDVALDWCRRRGADVMLHFEPDCLITGREWRENLLHAIQQGAWMAGANRKPWGPIHPTPSAWLVREARTTFQGQPKVNDLNHPRFGELVDTGILKDQSQAGGAWRWAEKNWDTADKAWFHASIHDRAALVTAPDFRHFWLGSTQELSREQLVSKFPEVAEWVSRTSAESESRRVEHCFFRRDVRHQAGTEFATCKLLQQLSGVEDSQLCEVRRDVCRACCESTEPSMPQINAVLASRLYRLTDHIVSRGGVEGCDSDSASNLRHWAEDRLEIRLPGEGSPPATRRSGGGCHYLGGEVGTRIRPAASGHSRVATYVCRHPSHIETTTAECRRCRDWKDKPLDASVPIERLLPPPARRTGSRVRHWAVGVTTAPRPQPTLSSCLDSLLLAGWEVPRLFVDSAVTVADRFSDLPLTFRETKLGPWPNYYLALLELLMREPEADAFMLVQDDVIFDDRYNLREYLEGMLWPVEPDRRRVPLSARAPTRARDPAGMNSRGHGSGVPWHSSSRGIRPSGL